MDKKANNILELMIDPTVVPVEKRVYFRPEEQLDNRSYEKAKSESFLAYRDQRHNSDMYPIRNRKLTRMGGFSMDRKVMIASLDILSKKFVSESDPMATDLRTMAYAFSEMSDDEFTARMAKEAVEPEESEKKDVEEDKTAAETFKCPTCGTNVLKQTGYCVKCKKKVKEASEEDLVDNWSKEASDAVAKALVVDVFGAEKLDKAAGKTKGPGVPDGTGPFGGTPECQLEKEKSDKEAGKIKGPGIPDGTGPRGGTPECQLEKEEEKKPEAKTASECECEKKDDKAQVEDKPVEAKTEKVEEKAAEVNTEILANKKMEIELTEGMITSADIGELSAEEKSKLDLLFQ